VSSTFSSREFNQDTGRAKKAAELGPVFITDRGKPSHVLLTMKEYERLMGPRKSWIEAFGDPEAAEIDFDVERERSPRLRPLELD